MNNSPGSVYFLSINFSGNNVRTAWLLWDIVIFDITIKIPESNFKNKYLYFLSFQKFNLTRQKVFRESQTVEESMLYIFVNPRAFRTFRALVRADTMYIVTETALSGQYLGQVKGNEAVLPTDPLGNIRDNSMGIACDAAERPQ